MTNTILTHFQPKEKIPPDITNHDDDTVATPPKGKTKKTKDREMIEKTVIITSSIPDKDAKSNFRFHHIQLLQELHTSFPTMKLFDNKDKEITEIDDWAKWSDPLHYMSHFKIHQKSGNSKIPPKAIIAHRIATTTTMQDIKNNPRVAKILTDHKIFLRFHSWKPEDWDTVQLGVLIGIDPISYNPDAATIKVNTVIKKAKVSNFPPFKIYRTRAQIQVNEQRTSAQVYMLEVKKKDAHEARKLMQRTYDGTQDFAFMALKAKFPKAFANALRTQNRYLQESYTVVITHIPESAYPHLCQALLKQPGVLDVLKHQRDEHIGKYLVMTTRTDAAQVKNYLRKNLEHLINQFPKLSTDSKFDENPQLMQGDFDDDSSNGLSWYSNSATTFNSIDFGEQQASYEESSTYSRDTNSFYSAQRKPSYAEATMNKESTAAATRSHNNVKRAPSRTPEHQHTTRDNDQYQQTPEDSDTSTEISSIRSLLSQYQLELERKEKEHQAQLQQQHQRMEAMFSQMQAMTMMFIQHSKPELVEEFLSIQNPKRTHIDEQTPDEQSNLEQSPWKRVDTKPTPTKSKSRTSKTKTIVAPELCEPINPNPRQTNKPATHNNLFECLMDNDCEEPKMYEIDNNQVSESPGAKESC